MRPSPTYLVQTLLVGMIVATGCAAPTTKLASKPISKPMTQPGRGMNVAPSQPASTATTQNPMNSTATVTEPQIAPEPIVQVGFQTVGCQGCQSNACSTGACVSSGCGGSGSACGPPHGYAAQPGPMNTYGVDGQEFLCDGGDQMPAAAVGRDDAILGLQPEDTIVHYTTESGDVEVKASNRVCVYAPRFKSVRKITGAASGQHSIGLSGIAKQVGASNLEINEGGVVIGESLELGRAEVARSIDAMRHRDRGVPMEGILQIEEATDVLAALAGISLNSLNELQDEQVALVQELALAAVAWTRNESLEVAIEDLKAPVLTRDQSVEGLTIYEFPDAGRLQICKLADRGDARPGETVRFAIRIENVGDSPVNEVLITDNLTTRLEYVDASQTCSVGAEFEAVPNEGQSTQLIWKLTDKLRVGESATIRFQCKVR